jgi:hypothetical protein
MNNRRSRPRLPAPPNLTTKATDHELQKYDIFTRYGQTGASMLPFSRSMDILETF